MRKHIKEKRQRNEKQTGALTYDEVKVLSNEFVLPCKTIYKLYAEFNCLKEMAKLKEKEEN